MGWNRFCKSPIKDVEQTLLLDISKEKDTSLLSFYVGCDSMLRRQEEICYTTVLVMLRKGAGGIGYYQKIKERDPHSTRKQRLFRETYEAVQAALFFNPILEQVGFNIKEVHTDLNPKEGTGSYDMIQQCIGYIKGMGFEGKVKPDAWAAYSAGDKFSK